MKDTRTPVEVADANRAEFMENGPGLRWGAYGIYVIARDPENRMVLLGGLGSMGCGQQWSEDRADCRNYAGYDDAPVRTCDDTLRLEIVRGLRPTLDPRDWTDPEDWPPLSALVELDAGREEDSIRENQCAKDGD